nr:MAG TPA: hypothetical protein [Caudoviricetes sp.]
MPYLCFMFWVWIKNKSFRYETMDTFLLFFAILT